MAWASLTGAVLCEHGTIMNPLSLIRLGPGRAAACTVLEIQAPTRWVDWELLIASVRAGKPGLKNTRGAQPY
jgi:hypothetical protein